MINVSQSIEQVPIDALIPYARNSRTHSDAQTEQVASSIKEFGFTNPVLIDGEGGIIAGHGRVLAARKLQMSDVPCIRLAHLNEAQKRAYLIVDNKLALNSVWDENLLALEIADLQAFNFDVGLTGFSANEIKDLLADKGTQGLTDPDAVPEVPKMPVSQLGDIWLLGKHRVMCGDSTDVDTVQKLMNGEKADIVFTSPPYNVGKTPNGNENKYLSYQDSKSASDYLNLLVKFTLTFLQYADFIFCNVQSLAGNKISLIDYLYQLKHKYADTIIWDKLFAEPAMGRKILNSRFEYIHIFSNESNRVIGRRDFRGTISNVFSLNNKSGKEFSQIHKATFRVELPLFFIENFSETSVIDPFGGVGTTLIASEKLNRKAYLMELDPKYVDVIVKRWQDFTGGGAILELSGQLFNEIVSNETR